MKIISSKPVLEGAGVRLNRVFGYDEKDIFDPFLLLDDFSSNNPQDYLAGFPWHPHRGIETVTYIVSGEVEHGDSIGNTGLIKSGDVQWMTAGSGIIHQEMPRKFEGGMQGFQLWVNLPKKNKLDEPRYREVEQESIPILQHSEGVQIKIISGTLEDVNGPVEDIIVPIKYFDVKLDDTRELTLSIDEDYTTLIYVYSGKVLVDGGKTIEKGNLALLDGSLKTKFNALEDCNFLYLSGKKIKEPIAWRGPIVMNTMEELDEAFQQYSNGTFLK